MSVAATRGINPLELHISAQHDMVGAQPRAGVTMRLRTPVGIDRQRRRVFENARAVALRGGGERQRVVERMDRERARIVDGVKIALAAQHRAHALGRPALDLAAQFAEQFGIVSKTRRGCRPWRHRASRLCGSMPGTPLDRMAAHIVETGLGQRPKILGALETDARDQLVGVGGETRQHKAGIAAGRAARQGGRLPAARRTSRCGRFRARP